jgi:hypothetical protein
MAYGQRFSSQKKLNAIFGEGISYSGSGGPLSTAQKRKFESRDPPPSPQVKNAVSFRISVSFHQNWPVVLDILGMHSIQVANFIFGLTFS